MSPFLKTQIFCLHFHTKFVAKICQKAATNIVYFLLWKSSFLHHPNPTWELEPDVNMFRYFCFVDANNPLKFDSSYIYIRICLCFPLSWRGFKSLRKLRLEAVAEKVSLIRACCIKQSVLPTKNEPSRGKISQKSRQMTLKQPNFQRNQNCSINHPNNV